MASPGIADPLLRNSNDSVGRPVQILESRDGEFVLMHDAINSILCHRSVGKKPISLISVIGLYRTGKSFLLNFIIRYLENEGYKNLSWVGEDDEELTGFAWRSGSQRETVGVWMWSEPFIVKKNKKEVAVFLVDAQGHFDMTSGKSQCSIAVILSMLFSSMTVFNIKGNVNSADLEFIEQCVEFSERTNEGDRACPLQAMTFLIRDWRYPTEYGYGSGHGQRFLDEKILNIGQLDARGSLKRMQDKLQSTFSPLECFLMPHPGLEAEELDFRGNLSDLSNKDMFLKYLMEFCNRVANPESIHLKKNLTGHQLMDLLIRNFEAMKGNAWELLEARSYEEIKQDNEASETFYQVAVKIGQKLDDLLQTGYIPEKDFKKKYHDILGEVMTEFRTKISFLGEKGVKRQEVRLKKYVELRHFKRTQMANEVLKLAKGNILEVALQLTAIGKTDMEEAMKKARIQNWSSDLSSVYKKVLKDANHALQNQKSRPEFKEGHKLMEIGLKCAKGFLELEVSLKEGVDEQNRKKDILNSIEREIETKRSPWECQARLDEIRYDVKVYEFKRRVFDEVKLYSEQIRATHYDKDLEKVLKKKKSRYTKEAYNIKQEFCPNGTNFTLDQEISDTLDKAFDLLRERDEKLKPFSDRLLELSLKSRKLLYLTSVGQHLDGGYATLEVLKELHDNILKELLPIEDEDDHILRKLRRVAKKELDQLGDEFKRWNEENKSIFRRKVGAVTAGLGLSSIGASTGAAIGLFVADIAIVTTVGAAVATGVGAAVVAGALIVVGSYFLYKHLRSKSSIRLIDEKKKEIEEGNSEGAVGGSETEMDINKADQQEQHISPVAPTGDAGDTSISNEVGEDILTNLMETHFAV